MASTISKILIIGGALAFLIYPVGFYGLFGLFLSFLGLIIMIRHKNKQHLNENIKTFSGLKPSERMVLGVGGLIIFGVIATIISFIFIFTLALGGTKPKEAWSFLVIILIFIGIFIGMYKLIVPKNRQKEASPPTQNEKNF